MEKSRIINKDIESRRNAMFTVLIVENNEGLNRLIKKQLEQAGFQTATAYTGKDCLGEITKLINPVLLLDYLLPDMTARNIIEKLREDNSTEPPFVVMTGHGDEITAVEMMKLGARDYIVKSDGVADLIPHVMNRVLDDVVKEQEHSRIEKELQRKDNDLQGLVETSQDLIWRCDTEGRYTFLNKMWEKTHKYSIKEMIGRKFTDFQNPEAARRDLVEFNKALHGETISGYVTTHLTKTGITVYLILNAVPLYDGSGNVIGVQGSAFDITEREIGSRELANSKEAFFNMLEDVNEAYSELETLFKSLVSTLVSVLDAKSPWTKGHSERVALFTQMIAREIGLKEEEVSRCWLAGILHDIGKIGTYDYLLDKPDSLSIEEFDIVKKHPALGAEMLQGIKQLHDIVPYIRSHHEQYDGSGYPDGLKGDAIPLPAKIIHVSDSYDSMTTDRPYRPAPSVDYALSEFERCRGYQFDPKVVDAFLKVLGK